MSISQRRCLATGLILGLARMSPAAAEDLPAALPGPAPAASVERVRESRTVAQGAAVARPAPPVVIVPPEGVQPTWARGPIDPASLERPRPWHLDWKLRSWHWRRIQGKSLGYPEEFVPRPLGAALYDAGRIMAADGAAARLVLFNYDFIPGTAQLSARGRDQLAQIAPQLAVSPYPLIIERTANDPALAVARRAALLAELGAGPFPVPADRVLVGVPIPFGMSGMDAHIVGENALNRTQQYGPPIPINGNGLNSPTGVTNSLTGVIPGQ